jgi:hypothetical protein
MEKLYFYLDKKTKYFSNILWLISLFSYLFFLMTSFYSIVCFYPDGGTLFTIVKYAFYTWDSKNITYTGGTIYPLQMHPKFFYIIIIIVSLISFFSFIFYSIFVIYKGNTSIYDEMLPNIHKYNSIPFICISFLFLLGESYKYNVSRWERRNILGFFFNIIGIISMLFVYYNYKIKSNSNMRYIYFLIKRAYSCILSLEWYYLCYIFTNLFILYLPDKCFFSLIKILGVILPLIYGIGSFIFSFIFKDIMVCLLSSLVNIGCSFYFFKIDKIYRRQYNEFIDGIIYIIFSILLLLETIILYLKYKKELKIDFKQFLLL